MIFHLNTVIYKENVCTSQKIETNPPFRFNNKLAQISANRQILPAATTLRSAITSHLVVLACVLITRWAGEVYSYKRFKLAKNTGCYRKAHLRLVVIVRPAECLKEIRNDTVVNIKHTFKKC